VEALPPSADISPRHASEVDDRFESRSPREETKAPTTQASSAHGSDSGTTSEPMVREKKKEKEAEIG